MHTVVDIGGQDVKVIEIENGMMKNFVMNDKCAAGTGRFLDVMARVLEVRVEDLGDLGDTVHQGRSASARPARSSPRARSSRQLAVGTRQVRHHRRHPPLGGGARERPVHTAWACVTSVVMTGGVAQNHGIVKALENQLGHEISTSPLTQYNGALGAALFAYQKALKKQP